MRLYKHHITPFLQVLLVLCALATLASCVSDKFWEQLEASRNPEPETTPYYLSLKIMDTSGSPVATTRAGFDDGLGSEHKVGESGNYVILLNSDKDGRSLYGVYPLQLYRWDVDYPDDNTKEFIYITRFYHDESKPLPEYGLVVLNANAEISNWLDGLKNDNEDEESIKGYVWGDDPKNIGFTLNDGDNSSLFTMTNSSYVKDGEVKVAENIEGHIAKSIEEARKNCVTVYVERMVAKFTFEIDDKATNLVEGEENIFQPSKKADIVFFTGFDTDGSTTYEMRKWCIEVTGWNVNALQKQTHLFKNIKINGEGYPDGTWNEASRHRSYWSEDPDYENYDYPLQFRNSIDQGLDYYYSDTNKGTQPILKNYSFDGLNLGKDDSNTQFTDFVHYAPEHTYNNAIITEGKLANREELLAGTHLLIGAELQFENDEGEYKPGNWYRDRSGIYYRSEKEYFAAQIHAFAQLLTSQEYMEFTFYYWKEDKEDEEDEEVKEKKLNTPWLANTSGEYKLYLKDKKGVSHLVDDDYIKDIMKMEDEEFTQEIGKMAEATLLSNDGKCVPWLERSDQEIGLEIKNEKGEPLAIHERGYDNIGAVIVGDSARTADPNDIKSLLYEWLGSADHFANGKMYYPTGIYSPTTSEKTNSYGVVRNTWYHFGLKGIDRIGIPVDSSAQPIVPDDIDHYDKANVSIKIIDWHKFDTTIGENELPGLK